MSETTAGPGGEAGRAGARARDRPMRRIVILGAAIGIIFAYGVTGYTVLGFSLLDGAYMTALALTTAGFTPAGPMDAGAKLFTVSVAILGVTAFFAILAVLGSLLVERQFTSSARRRRMQTRIGNLEAHFIVCAYGRMGRAVAREYEAQGIPFVVIDAKEELEDDLRDDGVLYLIDDPSSEATLRAAGVERARGLVCAVDSDAESVYITLTARALNPELFIVARAGEPETEDRLARAGADRVISPYVSSGQHMAILSLRPDVVDFFEVAGSRDRELRVDEIRIDPGSPLDGRAVGEARDHTMALLVRKADGTLLAGPPDSHVLHSGDILLVLVESGPLRAGPGGQPSRTRPMPRR